MLRRIKRIINAVPYTVVCEWSNGEIRAIQFEQKLEEWAAEPGSVYEKLLDKNIFLGVQFDVESKTLYWTDLINMKDTKGKLFNSVLDIDPDVLYGMSVPV